MVKFMRSYNQSLRILLLSSFMLPANQTDMVDENEQAAAETNVRDREQKGDCTPNQEERTCLAKREK